MPSTSSSREKTTPLADRILAGCRDGFLQAIDRAAREAIRHPEWLATLARTAGETFDEFVGHRESQGFEQAHGLTASRISLVHTEDLDFSIELINLEQRLHDHFGRPLTSLTLRMRDTLHGTVARIDGDSPVGSECICRAFQAFTVTERINAVEALTLIQQLEEPLKRHLEAFYLDMEQEIATAIQHTREAAKPVKAPVMAPPPPPPLLPEIPPLPEPPVPAATAPKPSATAEINTDFDPVGALRMLILARRSQNHGGAGGLDPSLAAALAERIEAWLDERLQSGAGLGDALGTTELGRLLPPDRAAAVEVVEVVFSHAANSAELPACLRPVLARLRIPLLRQALRSPRLLDAPRHPGLRLVDAIANLGRSLPPDAPADLAVCRGIALILKPLLLARKPEDGDFAAALTAVENLLVSRKQVALDRTASFQDEACHLERREVALHQASRMVNHLLADTPDGAARDFLESYWVQVLTRAAYRQGTGHPEWAARVRTAGQLLSSTKQPESEAERQNLRERLPPLMTKLQEGLRAVGLTPEQIDQALVPCRSLHSAFLAGRAPPAAAGARRSRAPSLGPVSGFPGLIALRHKHHLACEPALPPGWGDIGPGDSLALAMPNGSVTCGFVAWVGPESQILLIADGDSHKVLATTFRAFAQQAGVPGSRRIAPISLVEEATLDRLAHP